MSEITLNAAMLSDATLPGKQPFALLVDPSSIHAAAQRIAGLGLPRLVVKAFSEKDKEKEKAPRAPRRAKQALPQTA